MRALAGPFGLRTNCLCESARGSAMAVAVPSLSSASSSELASPSDGVGAAMVRACSFTFAFLASSFALAFASASAERFLCLSTRPLSTSGDMERALPAVAAVGDTGAACLSRNRYVVPSGSSHFA